MDDKAETEPNTINVMVWVNRKLTGPIQWWIQGGHPPMAQNFLNFMQFFGKFDKIICWRLPEGLVPPPTGNPGSAPAILIQMSKYLVICTCDVWSSKTENQQHEHPASVVGVSCIVFKITSVKLV